MKCEVMGNLVWLPFNATVIPIDGGQSKKI